MAERPEGTRTVLPGTPEMAAAAGFTRMPARVQVNTLCTGILEEAYDERRRLIAQLLHVNRLIADIETAAQAAGIVTEPA